MVKSNFECSFILLLEALYNVRYMSPTVDAEFSSIFYDAVAEENLLVPEEPDTVTISFLQFCCHRHFYFCRKMVFQ